MTELIKIEGIIINKQNLNDSDRILKIVTSTFGKVNVLVKGISKSKRRDKTAADVLSYSKLVVYKKDFNLIASSMELIESYENIRTNMEKLEFVLYLFSILNTLLNDYERNSSLFQLMCKSLNYINKEKEKYKYLTLVVFFVDKLISKEGISFQIQNGKNFSIENSYLGENMYKDSITLSEEEFKIICSIRNHQTKTLLKNLVSIKSLLNILKIYEKYLNYHLETNFNMKNYILEEMKW